MDIIVLQVRDPLWLYAYWELRPATLKKSRVRLTAGSQPARLILRVYEEGTPRWFDIEPTVESDEWAIQARPDAAWSVEIGLRTPRGTFAALAKSNVVRTPPDGPLNRPDSSSSFLHG